jgi:predicted small lipoprotein YifL
MNTARLLPLLLLLALTLSGCGNRGPLVLPEPPPPPSMPTQPAAPVEPAQDADGDEAARG